MGTLYYSNEKLPHAMKLQLFAILALVCAASALRVRRNSTIDDNLDDINAIVQASGDQSMIVIADHVIRFVQEEFYPLIETIKAQADNLDPMELTKSVFALIEDAGERMARGADTYTELILTDVNDPP